MIQTMSSYSRLVKDFFRRVDPSNPLHYYGYKHIVREEEWEKRRDRKIKTDGA